MLISADLSTNKTEILVDKYASLLNKGVKASEILVIVQNSMLKNNFLEKTLEKLTINCVEKLQIYSFYSLIYNTISDNWAFLENINPYPNPKILPNLAGLEISQFILEDLLKKIPFKGYNSKKSLLHQILRRYSLIVQNNLTDDEVDFRSRILKESFADDAKQVIKKLLAKTLELRDFDYIRQGLLFNYVYKNSDYFKNIKYLILDDGDEITPLCFDFIKYLRPQLEDVYIAFDEKGASRTGYLSADRTAVWKFEDLFSQSIQSIPSNSKLQIDAETIFSNITQEEILPLQNFSIVSPSKRASMIDECTNIVKKLISKNIKPSEISIVTPLVDDMLKFSLKENLSCSIIYLSGSEKLIQNRLVKSILTILKLACSISVTENDLRVVLLNFSGIGIKYCAKILSEFKSTGKLIEYTFQSEEHNEKYKKLKEIIENLKVSDVKLSEKVYTIFDELAELRNISSVEMNKFQLFIKQLEEFENILGEDFNKRLKDIIISIENSIIAENPYSTLKINDNDIIVSTPQKIIDNQIRTKYQIWLDTSSSEWIKSDTGPLYNAWVFQRGWEKDEFTIDDNIELSKEKTARILRKLVLCATEYIYTISSLFDGNGIENFGGIEDYIKIQDNTVQEENGQNTFNITPRDDQKPVLDYESGKMAISAVPGAGKTTILLALILKLLERGINPENIFVMTYMESAARNFRERIKNVRKNSSSLPNISTIHGLALRILKENGNYERLGLAYDFEICDDSQKTRIISAIASKMNLNKTDTNNFERCVSVYKISNGNFENIQFSNEKNNSTLKKFKTFFEYYQETLAQSNLIDYDDMLLASVKLLEENEDIRKYYQNICQYIIEDEAQDSSAIQQRLINLLSGKHKNLIRCGDINQAITTTFSNADVEGFRQFIKTSKNVNMNRSQRCAEDIWTLANKLLKSASEKEISKDAFFEIYMQPVESKNPTTKNSLSAIVFDNYLEEKNYVLNEIRHALKKNPKSTIGILLRNNFQVANWISFINNSGLKTITRSESLGQKYVFKVIYSVMRMIEKPFDNNNIADCYDTLSELGLYRQRLGYLIRKYEIPFIETNFDNIENIHLSKFYLDLNWWLSFPQFSPDELAVKIGLYYFDSEIEKSNVYLISTLIKRMSVNYKDFSILLDKLEELSKKSNLSGFKFFSEEDENNREFFEGKVQIMTMHKSKGDEFDYCFIPELSEKNLTLDFDKITLKSADFQESVKALNSSYKQKNEYEIKKEILAENLRLLYVAITRAKKFLYFTASTKMKSYNKIENVDANIIFEELLDTKHFKSEEIAK